MSDSDEDSFTKIDRGAPLVATLPRMGAVTLAGAFIFPALAYGYIRFTHSARTLQSLWLMLAIGALFFALLVVALLRAEESRLARELRTARSGTPVIRGMVVRRRQKAPIFLRLFSTTLGTAAVLLADGDRAGAMDVLTGGSPIMTIGRIQRLREVVDADVDRASGTSVGLERCVQTLRAMPRIGNLEADRYRTHVLVKAILQQAADDTAEEVLAAIDASPDDEERLYAVWLRTWFEIETGPAPTEGELRLAALLARSHGAEELVAKLDTRIHALYGSASRPQMSEPPAAPPSDVETEAGTDAKGS